MKRLRDLPIRTRIARVIGMASGLAFLLATVALATVSYVEKRKDIRADLQVLADLIGSNTTAVLAFGDQPAANETMSGLRVAPGIQRAALYDAEGRLFALYTEGGRLPPAAPPADGFRQDLRAVTLVQPVMLDDQRLGTLYLERGMAGLWNQLLRQVGIAAAGVLLALAAAGAFAARLQRTIAQPLRRLEDVAGRVASEGTRAARVEVEGHDEVSDALLAFNAMLDELAANEAALVAAKGEAELARAEAETARKHAEEASRLKSAFLANMSHEIRTPLTSIIGFSDLLRDEVTGEAKEYTELIGRGGRRLLDTLNAVLELSRLEAGRVRLDTQLLVVGREVREVVELLHPIARTKGLRLIMEERAPSAVAALDRVGLGQIVSNLVRNAIKFTPDGEVRVCVEATESFVTVEVKDTGPGIEESFLPHLFEEFRQASDGLARRHEGVGLGLAITHRLVYMMGGTITVKSEEHLGATFRVSFPRVDPAARAAEATPVSVSDNEPGLMER
ncbi:MAG TPA: ATP-binding protein [Rhodothermales bacterium]|nr:ATP-binding protein [Rhodothermales bacterium]